MNCLSVDRIVKRYGDKTAVDGLSFEVGEGEIYGLLGANGAGKTTTMRMVLGLIMPDEGGIRYFGEPYGKEQLRMLGYLPEERGMYPKHKISDQVVYLAQLRGMSRRDAEASLKAWLDKFQVPEYYNKKVEELSKGNQQKIQFIAAVIHRPRIVVLDEAFSGLDPVNVELLKTTVKELVRDHGTSIVFSTHRMEHVEELCRNITILHKAMPVLQGPIAQIKKKFPKERAVVTVNGSIPGLETIPGVREVIRHEHGGYELRLSSPDVGDRILKYAMGYGTVSKFEVPEPTLNEIFIKTVGVSPE